MITMHRMVLLKLLQIHFVHTDGWWYEIIDNTRICLISTWTEKLSPWQTKIQQSFSDLRRNFWICIAIVIMDVYVCVCVCEFITMYWIIIWIAAVGTLIRLHVCVCVYMYVSKCVIQNHFWKWMYASFCCKYLQLFDVYRTSEIYVLWNAYLQYTRTQCNAIQMYFMLFQFHLVLVLFPFYAIFLLSSYAVCLYSEEKMR